MGIREQTRELGSHFLCRNHPNPTGGMARGKKDLDMARAGYRDAKNRGDREEEARWANQIGHLLKARGEYVEALKWFRIDYDLSLKHLPQKQLMPTCQSIGEMYLRLQRFRDALVYQKKHLEFAQEADDLEEQQRASTQLCRTFFDIYDNDENNYSALRKAKKYSQMSLDLACTLKDNPPGRNSPSFVMELVNAYNNKGLLKIYLEDYKQAERVLMEGLRICDEEEVGDNDEVRTRLHHNLARIYIENRDWAKAREHANIDIGICQHIPHPQGEAQGFINLGVIHCKLQKYEDALLCFNKALAIVRSLEDEDALVQHIESNIETTQESQKILGDLVKGEQHLKKLDRVLSAARGMATERAYCVQQFKCLKQLVDLASQIQAWTKHLEFSKRSNRVAKELGDKEKLGDALLAVGESYYNLRKFDKANKWYTKSWKVCATIHNLEGQAVAKINIGNALDSAGKWSDALEAFQEGYKTAVQAKIISLQITALQNMHYSYLLRFDNLEDARKLEHDIEQLKVLASEKGKDKGLEDERCSETASSVEDFIDLSENELDIDSSLYYGSQKSTEKTSLYGQCTDNISDRMGDAIPIEDDLPLASYMRSHKQASQKRTVQPGTRNEKKCKKTCSLEKEIDSQAKMNCDLRVEATVTQRPLGCKRSRVLLSDDEESHDSGGVHITENTLQVNDLSEVDSTDNSGQGTKKNNAGVSSLGDVQNDLCILQHEANMCASVSKCNNTYTGDGNPIQVMDNIKNMSVIDNPFKEYKRTGDGITLITPLVTNHEAVGAQLHKPPVIPVRVGETVINLDARGTTEADLKAIDWLRIEVAQLFCLHLYNVNKSLGMKPVVKQAMYKGNILESTWLVKDLLDVVTPGDAVEAIIDGWVRLSLVERYLIFCRACGQIRNAKLLSKLRSLKISEEEEVVASDCELQDESVQPLLRAIGEGGTFSLLDLSHNSLGNQTVHAIQEMISASNKKDLGLTLDLHDNQLGSSALLQICHCAVSLSRLEVLNLSGNRLTDASARHLCAILEGCQALAILNLERCSLTTRTIQKISNALPLDSGLVKLSIGGNNPISGYAIADLLKKLSMLKSFSDLDMVNVELNKMAIDGLCKFLQASSSISGLAIGGTHIDRDGVLKLSGTLAERTMTLTKVIMDSCDVDPYGGSKLCRDFILQKGLLQLDLSGNRLEQRGASMLGQVLQGAECHLKILMINKCHLGQIGILRIIQALAGNHSLQELGLAGNNMVANETLLISETELSITASCAEEVMTTQNNQVESFENKASNCSDHHESPSAGQVFSEGISAEKYILAEERSKLAPLTCLDIDQNLSMAHVWDEYKGNKRRNSSKNDHQSNRNCGEYVVSDSEDEGKADDANCLSPYDNCVGVFKTVTAFQGHSPLFPGAHPNENASQELEINVSSLAHEDFASQLSSAICMAKNLQFLDLSDNFLPFKIVEHLYVVWSSRRRAGALAKKHIDGQVVHFCVEGKQCCGVKLCCQRDSN